MTVVTMSRVFLLPFLILTVITTVDTNNAVTCTCPETVMEGDQVVLACIYTKDMEQDHEGFYIVRRQPEHEPVIVAVCDWGDSLDCNLKPGYTVTVQGNSVMLNISSVKKEHAGVYSCNTLPAYQNVTVNGCTLTVQERTKRRLESLCKKHGEEASVLCTFPKDMEFDSIVLEKLDFSGRRQPVKIMQCYRDRDLCDVKHGGYRFRSSNNTYIETRGVTIPVKDVSKSGLYVCKTDADSSYYDMCTLTLDDATSKPKEEEESLTPLIVPLYAILGFLVLALIICMIFVVLRQKRSNYRLRTHQIVSADDRVGDEIIEMIPDNGSGSADNALPDGNASREMPNGWDRQDISWFRLDNRQCQFPPTVRGRD